MSLKWAVLKFQMFQHNISESKAWATTISKTAEENVQFNISKARKTVYSLLSAGLRGQNGLDPQTSLHITRIYVLPMLLYGLELILPNQTLTGTFRNIPEKILKRLLSVAINTPDPAFIRLIFICVRYAVQLQRL